MTRTLLQGHTDHVGGVAFSADGSCLATACEDRVVRLFKLADAAAKNLTFMKHNMTSTPVDVAFGSASNTLAVTSKGSLQLTACVGISNELLLMAHCSDTLSTAL